MVVYAPQSLEVDMFAVIVPSIASLSDDFIESVKARYGVYRLVFAYHGGLNQMSLAEFVNILHSVRTAGQNSHRYLFDDVIGRVWVDRHYDGIRKYAPTYQAMDGTPYASEIDAVRATEALTVWQIAVIFGGQMPKTWTHIHLVKALGGE